MAMSHSNQSRDRRFPGPSSSGHSGGGERRRHPGAVFHRHVPNRAYWNKPPWQRRKHDAGYDGFRDDPWRGGRSFGRSSYINPAGLYPVGFAVFAGLLVVAAVGYAAFVLVEGARLSVRGTRRRTYYGPENERRRLLARERRRIRRRTTPNPCPAPAALLAQFARVRSSPAEMIRFGSMIEDLECYVDNSAIFGEDGSIVGRHHGVRGWLQEECPELFARYKTVMRYKAMSKRFRQAAKIPEPVPAAAVFGPVPPGLAPAAARAEAILDSCTGTQSDLYDRLDRLLNPDRTPDAPGELELAVAGAAPPAPPPSNSDFSDAPLPLRASF